MIKKYKLLSGFLVGLLCSFNVQSPNAFGKYILDCMPSYRQYDLKLLAESDGKYCLFDDRQKYPKFNLSTEQIEKIHYKFETVLLSRKIKGREYAKQKAQIIEKYKNKCFFKEEDVDAEDLDEKFTLNDDFFVFLYNSNYFNHQLTFNHIFFKILGSIWDNDELEHFFIKVFETQDGTSLEAQKLREVFLNTLSKKEYLFLVREIFTINFEKNVGGDFSFSGIKDFLKIMNFRNEYKEKIQKINEKNKIELNHKKINFYDKKIKKISEQLSKKIQKAIKKTIKKNENFFELFANCSKDWIDSFQEKDLFLENSPKFLQDSSGEDLFFFDECGKYFYALIDYDENMVYFSDYNYNINDYKSPFSPVYNLQSHIMFQNKMDKIQNVNIYDQRSLPLYSHHYGNHTESSSDKKFLLNSMQLEKYKIEQYNQEERKKKFYQFKETFNKKFHSLLDVSNNIINYKKNQFKNENKAFFNFWLNFVSIFFKLTPQENKYLQYDFCKINNEDEAKKDKGKDCEVVHKIMKNFLLKDIENERNKVKRQINEIKNLLILYNYYNNYQNTSKENQNPSQYSRIFNIENLNIFKYIIDDYEEIFKIIKYYKDIYCCDYDEIFKRCIFNDLCFTNIFVYENMPYETNEKKLKNISLIYKNDYFKNIPAIDNLETVFSPFYTILTSYVMKLMQIIPSINDEKASEEKYLNILYFMDTFLEGEFGVKITNKHNVHGKLQEIEMLLERQSPRQKFVEKNPMGEENDNSNSSSEKSSQRSSIDFFSESNENSSSTSQKDEECKSLENKEKNLKDPKENENFIIDKKTKNIPISSKAMTAERFKNYNDFQNRQLIMHVQPMLNFQQMVYFDVNDSKIKTMDYSIFSFHGNYEEENFTLQKDSYLLPMGQMNGGESLRKRDIKALEKNGQKFP